MSRRAFTLLEVLIAVAILFVALFAILDLTHQSLRTARLIQNSKGVDFTAAAAAMLLTNRVEEGSYSGEFGEAYPNHDWSAEIHEVMTNGFFQVDITVRERQEGWNRKVRTLETKSSIYVWRPDSAVNRAVGR